MSLNEPLKKAKMRKKGKLGKITGYDGTQLEHNSSFTLVNKSSIVITTKVNKYLPFFTFWNRIDCPFLYCYAENVLLTLLKAVGGCLLITNGLSSSAIFWRHHPEKGVKIEKSGNNANYY